MSVPENYLKFFNLYTKKLNIWPENKLPWPEFRLLPENWHPCLLTFDFWRFLSVHVLIAVHPWARHDKNPSRSSFDIVLTRFQYGQADRQTDGQPKYIIANFLKAGLTLKVKLKFN